MNIAAGIDAPHQNVALGIIAHKKNPGCAGVESVCQHHPEEPTTHLLPLFPSPYATTAEPIRFRFEAHREGAASSWKMSRQRLQQGIASFATRPFGGRHTCVTRRHTRPRAMHALVHWQRSSTRGHNRSIQSLRAPVFIWRHFAAVPRLSAK